MHAARAQRPHLLFKNYKIVLISGNLARLSAAPKRMAVVLEQNAFEDLVWFLSSFRLFRYCHHKPDDRPEIEDVLIRYNHSNKVRKAGDSRTLNK